MNKLGAWVGDYAAAAKFFVAGVFQARSTAKSFGGSERPLVILPGVYEPWTFMIPLIDHIKDSGRSVHVIPDLGLNRRTIPESAEIAQRYLEELGLSGVTLIAHSKGGLIGKHMMLHDDHGDGRVESLIAISTPFSGSRRARYFLNRTVRDFLPTEPTLAALSENEVVNARITSIYAEWDLHIPEGSFLPGAHNVPLPLGGHFRVVGDPLVFAAVDAALEKASAGEPGPIADEKHNVEQGTGNDETE
jgi:pimeloyl-ACP methyl ester carboxylesterase